MDRIVLKVTNMTKKYGEITAVDNLNFVVKEGEIYGFLGPNGAGKTTTLKCCSGLLKIDGGLVEICSERVSIDGVEFRKNMAFIPDRPYLYEKLTLWEYLTFISGIRKIKGWEEKGEKLIDYLDLKENKFRLIETFSHGMKQKLVIISSILHSPKLLLIDEPMVGLDPKSARKVKSLLKNLAENGAAIVLSTHSLDVAQELSTRIGIINKGKMVAEGSFEDLKKIADFEGSDLEDVFLKITEEELEDKKVF